MIACVRLCPSIHIQALAMRTNIVIDDKLMADAMRATGLKTKRAVVELGLRRLVMLNAQARIRELRGTVHWEGDLRKMRGRD